MSAPTVKLVLRRQKVRPDGTAPVYLRVTHARRSRFTATGIAVESKHWNENKARVRAAHPLAPALNARLDDLLLRARRAALNARSAEAVVGLTPQRAPLRSTSSGSSTTSAPAGSIGTGRSTG